MTTESDNIYDAFRRADALWSVAGTFFTGAFADSPTACNPWEPTLAAEKIGWIVGTEDNSDDLTVELTDGEAAAFMERDGFVKIGSPEADEAADALAARFNAEMARLLPNLFGPKIVRVR
jgi:hypothetical protein